MVIYYHFILIPLIFRAFTAMNALQSLKLQYLKYFAIFIDIYVIITEPVLPCSRQRNKNVSLLPRVLLFTYFYVIIKIVYGIEPNILKNWGITMKKMISCLTAFALLASVPTAAVFAADTTTASTASATSTSDTAIAKIKDLNVILALTSGIINDQDKFHKVDDERFKTIASVKSFITETCTGDLREELLADCDVCLKETDGVLYAKDSASFFFTFLTGKGVVITDSSDKSFSAVTQENDEMNEYGRAKFELENGKWKISSYEFGYFTVNSSADDLAEAAYVRMFHLQYILDTLAYGAPSDSKDKITVDGKTYGKASDEMQESFSLYLFKEYISEHCTGELRDSLIKEAEERFIEKDDVVYAIIGARGAYSFNITNGITVSNASAKGFTATTSEKSDKDGYGRIYLAADDGKWLIKSYEFVDSADAADYTLGDVNSDGRIDAVDASSVLSYYSMISTNKDGGFNETQKLAADVNNDGAINAVDASCILSYYAYVSTAKDKVVSLEEYLSK